MPKHRLPRPADLSACRGRQIVAAPAAVHPASRSATAP